MKIIIETKKYGAKEVLFDDKDYHLIKDYVWHIRYDKGNFYARCNIWVNGKRKSPKIHRIILGISNKPRPHVDHKNRNGLDNRRCNLRIATHSENASNIGKNSRNTTGYKGVFLYKEPHQNAGKFTATTKCKDKVIHGGYFNTAIEAAVRYNEIALQYHGEFAFLNKIDKKELAKAKLYVPPKKEAKPPSNKYGYYGVTKLSDSYRKNPFRATVSGKCIGYFKNPIDAAKAYDKKAKERNGENAILNFK